MFYRFIKFILGSLIRKLWLGDITGLDKIPKKGACIICANHQSYLDFLLLSSVVDRRIYFLAAEVFYKNFLWIPLVKLTGQIKVDRESKDKGKVYESVGNVLNAGKILALFPEGTRSRTGDMNKAYNGAVKFSYQYKVPIIPVGIIGSFEAWPPKHKFPKIKKVDIFFGEDYYIKTDKFEEETRALMIKIAQLSNKIYSY